MISFQMLSPMSGIGSERSQRDLLLMERVSILSAGASADRGWGVGPTVGSTEEAALISKRQVTPHMNE